MEAAEGEVDAAEGRTCRSAVRSRDFEKQQGHQMAEEGVTTRE